MKNAVLVLCFVSLVVLTGCKKSPVVDIDAETQRELDEFSRRLDEQSESFRFVNRESKTVPATDAMEASPAGNSVGNIQAPSVSQLPQDLANNQSFIGNPSGENPPGDNPIREGDFEIVSPPQPGQHVTHLEQKGSLEPVEHVQPANVAETSQNHELTSFTFSDQNQPESRLDKSSSPEQVCTQFLAALSRNDHLAATNMLTNVAQIETGRANLELESPGTPGSTFEVLPAKYATTARKVAQVDCLLRQPGVDTPVKLTWMMRLQYNGWKISGMAVQLVENEPADLLSFENPKDLRRIQSTVDAESASESAAHTAASNDAYDVDRR